MTYAILPAQEIPSQITVRTVSKTLGDHFAGFIAANNLNGYLSDPDYVLRDDRIGDILLKVTVKPGMSLSEMKQLASSMVRLTSRHITHSRALELISRALGYPTYYLAQICRDREDYIGNVWAGEGMGREMMYELSGLGKGRNIFRNSLISVYYQANHIRNELISQKEKRKKK